MQPGGNGGAIATTPFSPSATALVHESGNAGDERRVEELGMSSPPADVGGGEHVPARVTAEDVLHRRRKCDRVTADVALHALRLAGGAGGVEDVRGFARFEPFTRNGFA